MQKIRDLIHYILLATTPSLFAHPGHFPSFEARETDWTEDGWDETPDDQIQETWKVPTTYDEVIDMLEDLECGTPEEKYSLVEFEKINNYIITLARPHQLERESPVEEYERVTFKGHQVIDHIFSTDQAKDFTPEAKANDPRNEFTCGYDSLRAHFLL